MEQNQRRKKCFIVYDIEGEATISMIVNPNTELEFKTEAKVCHSLGELGPSTHVFSMEMRDENFLLQKNSVVFEISYSPQMMYRATYYSDRYGFSLTDGLFNYFMIGLKFKPSLQNLLFIDPPGKPLNNNVKELVFFFNYLMKDNTVQIEKGRKDAQGITYESLRLLQDLLEVFKIMNSGAIYTNQKSISDYFKYMDDFVIQSVKSKDSQFVFLMQACMYGLFPYDFFTGRESSCKAGHVLLHNVAKLVNIETMTLLEQEYLKELKAYLINGYFLTINMAIKDGFSDWTHVIQSGHIAFLSDESVFWTRIYDYIRKSGTSLKSKEGFIESKKALLHSFYSREKEIRNPQLVFTQLLRNIGILSMNKENLLETVIEFYESKHLDYERLKTLKDEIKRKRWELESEENYSIYISKLRGIIALETGQIKDEFKSLMYENTSTIRYLFTVLKNSNYEGIDSHLLKRSINSITEVTLDDYSIVCNELAVMGDSMKIDIFNSGFFDRLKIALKKVNLPFSIGTQNNLKILLLNLEIFPSGSLDYIREFIKNKPSYDDLYYIIVELVKPQKHINTTKNYNDLWLGVKNHMVNVFIDIYDLIKYFSLLVSTLEEEEPIITPDPRVKVQNSQTNLEFKKWITDEFWKSVSQRYTNEIFLSLCSIFNPDRPEQIISDSMMKTSYFKNIRYYLEGICNEIMSSTKKIVSYDKINVFFSAISALDKTEEKVAFSGNDSTEDTICLVLNKLEKSLNEDLMKRFIYENPSKDAFWYRLIKIQGSNKDSIITNPYFSKVKSLVLESFNKVKNNTVLISDFILVDKHNQLQREAIIAYFEQIAKDNNLNTTKEEIETLINEQIVLLNRNLNLINDLESFFSNYGMRIQKSKEFISYLKQIKDNFKTPEFKSFQIRKDLEDITEQIQTINKWNDTVMFRNIFDTLYSNNSSEGVIEEDETTEHQENKEKRLTLNTVLELCSQAQNQIKLTLNDILFNADFSKLTLSLTQKYFKGLENHTKESQVINNMIGLEEQQLTTLNSILSTFCEITNYIKFSTTMISLDRIYSFKSSHCLIYNDFLVLINNKETSFDKIFEASKKLSELRKSFMEKQNIENILFELSEDQDLILFLLNTPEDDIRNMVDAVDEHGDSFIRVQTIRDLLIIGSFIRRLQLKDFSLNKETNPTEDDLIERIHSTMGKNNFNGIEVLMNSCSKQFTGIKHLHSELSNREEASKIKAKEIAKQSRFEFNFTNKGIYEVSCFYGKSQKKISFRDLCDLRDRVLLLLYNEKDNKEDVVGLHKKVSIQDQEKEALIKQTSNTHQPQILSLKDILSSFIKSIELTEKILFVLQDIFHNGYPIHFSQTVQLKEGYYLSFKEMYDNISELNKQWNEDLKEAYTNHYSLSLFTGNQFWEIESLLIKSTQAGTENIDHLKGFFLLKLANPRLKVSDFDNVKSYSDITEVELNNMKPKERILKLGESLSLLINLKNIGAKELNSETKKVSLNLKGNKFIFSSISNLKIYTYLLSIHISIENSIPSSSQIFFCTKHTTFHEIINFLYRMAYSPVQRLFTMIKVESLSFELQNFLVEQVNKLSKIKTNNACGILSIICSDNNSFLHNQFSENNQLYLMRDFDVLDEVLLANSLKSIGLNTTIVRSDDTGAGKTHWIQSKVNPDKQEYIDFPILDSIDENRLTERLFALNKSSKSPSDKFFHITVMGIIDDYEMLDYILFRFIIIENISFETYAAFRTTSDPLYLEIANTYNDFLFSSISILNLLPDHEFITAGENIKNIKINKDYNDNLQMVINYLSYYDTEELNETEINPEVQLNVRLFSREECLNLLEKYFIKGKTDITFRQVSLFLNVLSNQLNKFSENYYFSVENIGYIQEEGLDTIRQKIMSALLEMTEEFTTRSIKEAREQQNLTVFKLKRSYSREEHVSNEDAKQEEFDTLGNILSWSSSNHLLVMFHADGMCVTPVYREADKVGEAIRDLVESQRTNLEDYQVFSHFELLEKLLNIVGKDFQLDELSKQTKYILTADNFLKMLLIIMRARCGVPIVIMGETGCGKTSLVRFLATEIMQEGFEVINFHAGIKEYHILEKMEEVIQLALSAKVTENYVWVFLDEINTCDCLGLITELIVNKSMLGKKLPDNIVFIAACNPYKVRKAKGEVGLIKQRVATRLVYRVHPLPDSLIDYVWDYGSLSYKEESLYIGNILQDISGAIKETAIDLVCNSQQFIRTAEDKYSVSLRDVARFNILHEWFHNMLTQKNEELINNKDYNNIQYTNYFKYFGTTDFKAIKYTGKLMISRKALILSLMMCYYNRISKNSDRAEYKKMVTTVLKISIKELDEMIYEEQRDLVTRMELPPAIAINKALLENVFTLMVCVINKIPLFICGKPGCSKSLSVQLLVSNLRGQDSNDAFFKKLPRILAIPYQGSESSTSEGIEKIFEKARGVLSNAHDNSILPLIVFDEIGLAEISKNNPLKILHSLLEPEKAELAFVGISNWRLDASKMNRAVYLARPDPDLEDLENTALSIFEYYIKEPRFDERLIMKSLAKTYYEFKKEQKEAGFQDFHGTRDFYALLKQVTREFNQNYNNYNEMKLPILRDAICRNFGGLDNSITKALEIFARNMNLGQEFINPIDNVKLKGSDDVISLVKRNLSDRDSRFLLLFTNGESASYILDNYLKIDLKERIFIIGSEFSNDKNKEEHSFKLLSDIILYMESGNSIILKNLDQVYGSLYDLFNQNFMIVGEKKNCRIALGSTNNPMCYVNNSFHCVVLVDLKDMDRMDPPFLNRFEKQILTFETILTSRQKVIVKELNKWISELTSLASGSNANIDITELIITYNDELSPSVVLTHFNEIMSNEDILELCKRDVLSVSSISLIVYSILSKMYQTARDEVLKSHRIYFEEQFHDSLDHYLKDKVEKKQQGNKCIIYTYSNILDEFRITSISKDVTVEEGKEVDKGLLSNSENIFTINIAEIKSEKELDSRFKTFLSNPAYEWVLIKVDAEKEKQHIPMIKFKIDKYLQEAQKTLYDNETLTKNVLMVVYLTRKNLSNIGSETKADKEEATLIDKLGSSLEKDNKNKLESHFLSGWDQTMIDCLGGGQIENLKNLLDLSTLEIVKKNMDQKSIAELIFDIYLKFNFNTYNMNDSSLVKLYMTESIHKIENDTSIFEIIFKKCLEFLEEKELPDWKLKICCDSKIISKSVNTFSAIKLVIQDVVSDPLLKIIHYLETESALSAYFHDDFSEEKASIFKEIWISQFEKKDLNAIYPYNVVQSLNVNCVFNLTFPFSKSDIYETISGLRSHFETIHMIDNAAYNYLYHKGNEALDTDAFRDLKLNFSNEMETISNIVRNGSMLFKITSKYSERSLEFCYISDLVVYFLLIEMKKEYKWKNCLEIIVRKSIGFDIENLEYIYIFLFKNRKILDAIFNIFNTLQNVFNVQYIESILLKDSLYDCKFQQISDIQHRRNAELNTFLNIFNIFSQVIICQMNNLKTIYEKSKEDLYAIMLNVYISSLMNFSLEIQGQPEAMNLILVVNEFLKFLSNIYKNKKEDIATKAIGIVDEQYDKIDIKNFNLTKDILAIMDKEIIELEERSKNPDNDIPSTLLGESKANLISSKLTIFESVLNGKCDFEIVKIIIENILKDQVLCRYSAMIFKLIYSQFDINEKTCLEICDFPISAIIQSIIDDENKIYSFDGVICSFLTDFFRKFYKNPNDYNKSLVETNQSSVKLDKDKEEEKNFNYYLNKFLPTLKKCLELSNFNNKNTLKYNRLICFSFIKHYLDIYGLYISNDKFTLDKTICDELNKILNTQEGFYDILRTYVLKTFAFKIGGSASGLVNIDYSKINVEWVNNKVFETNDNALGLEPNLPAFEKLNKEYSLFFVSLVNEDSKETVDKFKNMIKDSKERTELKFIIIQFFINKIWLSYSNPKFIESHTLKFVISLVENVKNELVDNLGQASFDFISNLISNFVDSPSKYFTISSSTESNKVGMMLLGLQAFNLVLSFKTSECSFNKLFYDDKDNIHKNFDHFKTLYIPGGFADYHDENLLLMMKHIDENYQIYGTQMGLYECVCGFLYTIGDCTRPYYVGVCPSCNGPIGGTGHRLLDGHVNLISADNRGEPGRKKFVLDHLRKKLRNIAGYISKMADELSVHYCIRSTSAVGFRFLNQIISSIIILLHDNKIVDEKSIDGVIEIKGLKLKAIDYFTKHLNTNLVKLSELIKSKEYYLLMHVMLSEMQGLCKENFKFDNSIEREKFEVAFESRIVKPKMDRLAGEISDFKQLFVTDKKLTYLSIIDEDYKEEDINSMNNAEFFRLFRFTRVGFWDDMKNEFMRQKGDKSYHFTKILAEKFDELQLVSNLYPIIQFTNYMMNLCNYRFSRAEAKEKKIKDVIEGNDTAIRLFEDFCKSWSKIAYKTTQWACKQLPVLDKIDSELPLSFVLIDDRELGYGMYMAAAFQYLGMIQNEVLEGIVYLIKENNNYQIWGNMDTTKYPIQKISSHEIVMYQTDKNYVQELTDDFSKFYDIYNQRFGQGGIVEYNFEKIENELAYKLLTNKKFVNYEDLTKIQYKFELLSIQNKHSNLLNDIKRKVDQKMLSYDDSKDIKKALERIEKQNVAYLHQIFSSLEIVLCNLRYGDTGTMDNITLTNYINKLPSSDKVSNFLKTTEPLCSVMLSNILSFYSLVEEQIFKYIVEYISPDYTRPLEDSTVRDILKWFADFAEMAQDRYPTAEQLIKVLQRFIIRCLVATLEPKFPIKEYLNRVDFWDVDVPEEVIDNFYFEFPDEIFISNTISFLELMTEYNKSKHDDGKLDIATDKYKFDAIREEMFKKQNKFN